MKNPDINQSNPEHFTPPTDEQLIEIVDLALLYAGFSEVEHSPALQQDIIVVPQFIDPEDEASRYTFSGATVLEAAFTCASYDNNLPTNIANYMVKHNDTRLLIERQNPSSREDTPAAIGDLAYIFEASFQEDKDARDFEAAVGLNIVNWDETENLLRVLRRLRRKTKG